MASQSMLSLSQRQLKLARMHALAKHTLGYIPIEVIRAFAV